MSSTSSRVSALVTDASGMWMVASTTLSGSDQNIIATRRLPVRCASRSVCPFHGRPARANANLFTGAVATAATHALRDDCRRVVAQCHGVAIERRIDSEAIAAAAARTTNTDGHCARRAARARDRA